MILRPVLFRIQHVRPQIEFLNRKLLAFQFFFHNIRLADITNARKDLSVVFVHCLDACASALSLLQAWNSVACLAF